MKRALRFRNSTAGSFAACDVPTILLAPAIFAAPDLPWSGHQFAKQIQPSVAPAHGSPVAAMFLTPLSLLLTLKQKDTSAKRCKKGGRLIRANQRRILLMEAPRSQVSELDG
jgi:hypothetical protein